MLFSGSKDSISSWNDGTYMAIDADVCQPGITILHRSSGKKQGAGEEDNSGYDLDQVRTMRLASPPTVISSLDEPHPPVPRILLFETNSLIADPESTRLINLASFCQNIYDKLCFSLIKASLWKIIWDYQTELRIEYSNLTNIERVNYIQRLWKRRRKTKQFLFLWIGQRYLTEWIEYSLFRCLM